MVFGGALCTQAVANAEAAANAATRLGATRMREVSNGLQLLGIISTGLAKRLDPVLLDGKLAIRSARRATVGVAQIALLAAVCVNNAIATEVGLGTADGAAIAAVLSAVFLAVVALFGPANDVIAAVGSPLALGRAGAVLGIAVLWPVVAFLVGHRDPVAARGHASTRQIVEAAQG